MKVFAFMEKRGYVANVLDNRAETENGLITVVLKEGYFFKNEPDVFTQSYATLREACAGCSKNNVFNPEEDAKKAETKAGKAKAKADAKAAPKVQKVPKASKALKVEKVVKATKELSMTPDAIAKRAKRAAQKVAAAAIVAEALVS